MPKWTSLYVLKLLISILWILTFRLYLVLRNSKREKTRSNKLGKKKKENFIFSMVWLFKEIKEERNSFGLCKNSFMKSNTNMYLYVYLFAYIFFMQIRLCFYEECMWVCLCKYDIDIFGLNNVILCMLRLKR